MTGIHSLTRTSLTFILLTLTLPVSAQEQANEPKAERPKLTCNLDSLPDDPPEMPVIRKRQSEDGVFTLRRFDVSSAACGFSMSFRFEDREKRAMAMRRLPAMVRSYNRDVFGIFDGEYRRENALNLINMIVAEDWLDGTRRAANVAYQKLDPDRSFDADEGAICMLVLSEEFAGGPDASPKERRWNRTAEKLMTSCLQGIQLTPEAQRLLGEYDAADDLPETVQVMARQAEVLEEAKTTLFPDHRPETWPEIMPPEDRAQSPPGISIPQAD